MKDLISGIFGLFADNKEEQDELPLDGTARTRLVNMRVRKSKTEESQALKNDLLTKLRRSQALLKEQRDSSAHVKTKWLMSERELLDETDALTIEALTKFYDTIHVTPDAGNTLEDMMKAS